MKNMPANKSSLMVKADCPHCGATHSQTAAHENGFDLLRCWSCRYLYVSPRPSDEAITEAHRIGEHQGEVAINSRERRSPKKVDHYANVIRQMFRDEIDAGKPVRWLDVGAGYGEFIEAVQTTMPSGTDAIGIEPMPMKVKAARAHGVNVRKALLSDVTDLFDVVSIINVYSHVPNFVDFGQQLVKRLRPGGLLFVETGNLADLDDIREFEGRLHLPDHLVFGGVRHIEEELRQIGLSPVGRREERIDTLLFCLKSTIKSLLRARKLAIAWPGRSPLRTVFFKARAG